MGGVMVVLAGNSWQTVPVIAQGTEADKLQACIKSLYVWSKLQECWGPHTWVQIAEDTSVAVFAENVLKLGSGGK
jgi:hypothetical protein